MKNKKTALIALIFALAALCAGPAPANAARKGELLVAVSADIVEITGSFTTSKGFAWTSIFDFEESAIPGIFSIGDFERKSKLATRLRLMETEGKAQILSNPKVIAKNNSPALISAGGEIPFQKVEDRTAGIEFKKYGILLNVLPTIYPEHGKIINVQVQLQLSAPDYSRVFSVNGMEAPAMTTRELNSEVQLNSGETLVIGGLKSSSRSVSEERVPFLGRIPLIGLLFKTKNVIEEQRSLFLFITVELVE